VPRGTRNRARRRGRGRPRSQRSYSLNPPPLENDGLLTSRPPSRVMHVAPYWVTWQAILLLGARRGSESAPLLAVPATDPARDRHNEELKRSGGDHGRRPIARPLETSRLIGRRSRAIGFGPTTGPRIAPAAGLPAGLRKPEGRGLGIRRRWDTPSAAPHRTGSLGARALHRRRGAPACRCKYDKGHRGHQRIRGARRGQGCRDDARGRHYPGSGHLRQQRREAMRKSRFPESSDPGASLVPVGPSDLEDRLRLLRNLFSARIRQRRCWPERPRPSQWRRSPWS
jgi:hypothetical protein